MNLFWSKLKLLWVWIKPLLEKSALDFLTIALPVARDAILAHVPSAMSAMQKRSAALKAVYRTLTDLGYRPEQISQSLLELAFNMAFRRLRAEGMV